MRPKCNRRRPRNGPDSTEADTYNLFKEFTMEPLWRNSHTVFTRALDAAAAVTRVTMRGISGKATIFITHPFYGRFRLRPWRMPVLFAGGRWIVPSGCPQPYGFGISSLRMSCGRAQAEECTQPRRRWRKKIS